MKISIALASYNGGKFIGEQLASFSVQTRLPDEVVICDDASADDTCDVADRFAASAPFSVRIHRNPQNFGFNGNFERALSLCEGDIIFLSDQDDIWYPYKLEKVIGALESRPDMLALINDEHLADADCRPLNATFLENVRKLGYPDSYHVAGCCTALRRELLPLLLPFPQRIHYDSWLATMTDLLDVKIILDLPLQLYRRHGRNTTDTILADESASVWKLARQYGFADPRRAWAEQIEAFEAYRHRLEERRDIAADVAGPDRLAAAFERIDVQIDHWSRRLQLLSAPRLQRFPSVLRLWRDGFYRHFAGGKSALKDMIRA